MAKPRPPLERVYGPPCQHPNARDAGVCRCKSVGEFDIPPDYKPKIRHGRMGAGRELPPRARLCRRHAAMVDAHRRGLKKFAGNSHEALCVICQHPRGKEVIQRWVDWFITTVAACTDLNVTHTTFYNHIHHFGLMEVKMARPARKKALLLAAERGLAANDHTVRTGLTALDMLGKAVDPPPRVAVDHSVSGVITHAHGVVDFSKMTDEELAQQAEMLSVQLRETAAALPPGETDDDVIDVVPTRPAKARRSIERDRVQHGRR